MMSRILINANADVSSGANISVRNNGGNSETQTLGTVEGDAILGIGDDVFILEDGSFDGDVYGDEMTASADDGDDAFIWTGGEFLSSYVGGNGSDTAVITAATYDGTYHVLDGGDDYSSADGWTDELTLGGDVSGDINGANLLHWERIYFDAVEVSIADGAMEVGGDAGDGLFLINGSILDQSGIGLVLTGNLTNNAVVTLQDGAVGDMITVGGSYAGMGQLLVDIDTGTDAADTMTVAGDSSGMTGIVVNNLSPGDATGNDILLVSVAGASAEGDFALVGGPVVAGAFQYDLEYQTGDFVLAAMLSSTGGVFEAAPHVLLDGFTRMPTLEQRVGQRRWNSAAGTLEPTSGGWIRIQGDWSEATLDTGTSYDADSWGLQAGFDLPVEPGENGQWVLGLTAQTGRSSAGITTMTGTGSVSAESLGIGATATWYGYNDFYVDLQAQVNWAGVDYSSSLHGVLAEDELARTAAASIEVGRRFALDANSGLIPQAQLTWASVDGGSFIDSAGNAVDLGTTERVTGRLGLAYDYEWEDTDQGSMQNVYGIVNILHDFSSDASVDVAGASLASEREATWGEIGLGGSMTWNETTTLYGEASYRQAFGSSDSSGLAATAGLRSQW
jgi:outer membrane autotransporter protein